jgi:hypothetical protein
VRQTGGAFWFVVTTTYASGYVSLDYHDRITYTDPVYRRWVGSPMENMLGVMRRRGTLVSVKPL